MAITHGKTLEDLRKTIGRNLGKMSAAYWANKVKW